MYRRKEFDDKYGGEPGRDFFGYFLCANKESSRRRAAVSYKYEASDERCSDELHGDERCGDAAPRLKM